MNKRTREIKVRLTEEEFEALTERVKRTGSSRERYIRKVIAETPVIGRPSHELMELLAETKRIGTDLGFLRHILWNNGIIDRETIENTYRRVWEVSGMISKEFIYVEEILKKKGANK